jgi:aspartyl-tRNA(Asn)/glutamyl-tRNA(Gln) amidotransferase subunit A
LLCLANFAGTPSITIPFPNIGKMPWGINLNCKAFEDKKLLDISFSLENIFEKKGNNE